MFNEEPHSLRHASTPLPRPSSTFPLILPLVKKKSGFAHLDSEKQQTGPNLYSQMHNVYRIYLHAYIPIYLYIYIQYVQLPIYSYLIVSVYK